MADKWGRQVAGPGGRMGLRTVSRALRARSTAGAHLDEVPAEAGADDGQTPALMADVAGSCMAMCRYALSAGMPVAGWIVDLLSRPLYGSSRGGEGASGTAAGENINEQRAQLADLVRAHDHLARLVAPALPQTLVLLERESRAGGLFHSLGPVRLVRQLMVGSIVFLLAFVTTSLSPHVNLSSGDLFKTSGLDLLTNQLFFLSASGMGASFAALFQVNRYITKGVYDPKYDTSYWARFILGLIAGIVLAGLIPVKGSFSKPLLALVGGFSASVVYRILTRIVETLESFVAGETSGNVWRDETSRPTESPDVEQRLRLARSLIDLQREPGAAVDAAVVNAKLGDLVAALLDGDNPPPSG